MPKSKPRRLAVAILLAMIGVSANAVPPSKPLPAFPGAEGFGAAASGGKDGTVYHVTTLEDSGPGSFRDAVSQQHRMVVFDVGGTIILKSPVAVQSDITIDGLSAPGSGIGVFGQEVSFSQAKNIIVRYIRFRQGIGGRRGQSAVGLRGGSDLIFDHVSIAWGRWDTIDMNKASDVTFQNCLIGPGVNPQRFGCLCQSDDITFSHCLWIDNQSRNPKAKGHIQFINNVVYNWGVDGFVGGHSAADHFADLIGNIFIKGPSSNDRFIGEYTATDHFYQSGNLVDLDRDGKFEGRPIVPADFDAALTLASHPYLTPAIPVTVDPPSKAFAEIIAGVGDSHPRDAVDADLIAQLQSMGTRGATIEDPAEMGIAGPWNGKL